MNRGGVIAAMLAITALSFYVFPGHTYLQQDTQIYVPILENQWSGALAGDLLVQHPHVNFTLYDELTNSVRWLTRAPLELVLELEQLVFRAFGFFGIYWIALSFEVDAIAAIVVTAMFALGAAIKGPEVLTIEYEPTPRSFAVPLLLLAAGLALHKRYWWAGLAGACAFVLHAPTTWPFWLAYLFLIYVRPRAAIALIPLAAAVIALVVIGFAQPTQEHQRFFERLPEHLEQLQRMRASYNYVSTWWTQWMPQYLAFAAVAFVALWRTRAGREHWALLGGLVVIGILSVPLSWLLLEQAHLALIPQVQPARALLFVTAVAVLTGSLAGCVARERSWIEGAAWFGFVLVVPAQVRFFDRPGWRPALTIIACALILAGLRPAYRVAFALALPLALAMAGIVNYRNVETRDLAGLAKWAQAKPGVYVFPEAGHDRAPGWFRAESLQPVYVDWKGGGQVNYLLAFGEEWWRRWRLVMTQPVDLDPNALPGIDYVVLTHPVSGTTTPVYNNQTWFVYALRPAPRSQL